MIELKSMAVTMPDVAGHPNRAAFSGVLTMVDVPSQRPPSGAKGHLVVLTKRAAEAALPSLLGMGVDYSPTLDRHDVRCKVGVITRAEIVGRNVELGGYLFARDFPEIVEEIAKSGNHVGRTDLDSCGERLRQSESFHGVAQQWKDIPRIGGAGLRSSLRAAAAQVLSLAETLGGKSRENRAETFPSMIRAELGIGSGGSALGMSYEVTGVRIAERRARVWVLEKVTFTGAAILRRDKAAYQDTWIELTT
ncbi:MAG: hypothetical protein WAL56_22600 [Candidatus Sulfotelmatobacter sp.]